MAPEAALLRHQYSTTRDGASYLSDQTRFPPGSVEFDSALIMRNIPHEWRALRDGVLQAPALHV